MESSQINDSQAHDNVINLIAKQRLLRLVEGAKFYKYTSKGQRVKDRYLLCKLSPNHRFLYYSDHDDINEQTLDDMPNKINVANLKALMVQKECAFVKDVPNKKSIVDLALTLTYDSDREDSLNMVALDHKTFCHWTDGFNVLLKQKMLSEEAKKDYDILYKIEMKIRSL